VKIRLFIWLQDVYEWVSAQREPLFNMILSLSGLSLIFKYITPNDLCYLRIGAAIVILALYIPGYYSWMFWIFVVAVLFDLIDGPLARSTNQVTEEEKKLDPIADKVLISVPLLTLGASRFSGQTILMFLLVEGLLIITAYILKPCLREKFSIPLTTGSNVFGQVKMNIQAVAVGIILFDHTSQTLLTIGEILIWVSIGFGIGSFLRHLARMDSPVEPIKRIITVPNLITLSGIFLIIPAGFALFREQWWLASVYLAWIFNSDWIDGLVARRFNQVTAFGAVLDPTRDYLARFLVIIWFFHWLDILLVRAAILAIVIVEVTICLISISTAKRCKTVKVINWWGKSRTIAQYSLLGIVFFHNVGLYQLSDAVVISTFLIMFVFSLVTLISYVDLRRRLINELNNR